MAKKSKKSAGKKATPKQAGATATGAVATFDVGDVVLFDGSPGRVCRVDTTFGHACVMLGEGVGCARIFFTQMTLAPPGTDAPACVDCDVC